MSYSTLCDPGLPTVAPHRVQVIGVVHVAFLHICVQLGVEEDPSLVLGEEVTGTVAWVVGGMAG